MNDKVFNLFKSQVFEDSPKRDNLLQKQGLHIYIERNIFSGSLRNMYRMPIVYLEQIRNAITVATPNILHLISCLLKCGHSGSELVSLINCVLAV